MADEPRPDRPALDIHFPPSLASLRPRLDALLDDFDPFAVEETGHGARRVWFFAPGARDAAARAIQQALGRDGAQVVPRDLPDDGWAERSQAELAAIRVGTIVVAPPWDPPARDAPALVVEIVPSTGFGTGHHASTRLCLVLMQRMHKDLAATPRVIDLGTGSGVLAIAAVRLGARAATGVERDPDALRNARENVERNRVAGAIDLLEADFTLPAPQTTSIGTASVVTANLTGSLFAAQAPAVLQHVAPGGLLVASGFTDGEEAGVRAALRAAGAVVAREIEDHWVGLAFRRSAAVGPR